MKTAEFVSPKHPDKICDFIADAILDAFHEKDEESRVAMEVMGGHNLITINGEATSRAEPNIESIVRAIVGADYKVIINLSKQSSEIAQGVDIGGAGDQGIMRGYATLETESLMPLEYELARNLCMKIYEKYPFDGKTQVTIEDRKIKTVVASFQNTKNYELLAFVKEIILEEKLLENNFSQIDFLINKAGEWSQGGFDADTGLSGRKLIVDNYGPEIPIGGGSFSGKDYTKVDRSGAYMARRIAVDYLRIFGADKVYTKLAYAIGKPEPVMAMAKLVYPDKEEEVEIKEYDLSPRAIRQFLKLDELKHVSTSDWGHFGRGFEWDK